MSDKCKQHPWHYEPGCKDCKAWSETAASSLAAPPGSADPARDVMLVAYRMSGPARIKAAERIGLITEADYKLSIPEMTELAIRRAIERNRLVEFYTALTGQPNRPS